MPPDEFLRRARSHSSGLYRYRTGGGSSSTSPGRQAYHGSSTGHSSATDGRHQDSHRRGTREGQRGGSRRSADPIYHARSTDGVEWEVYAGDGRWTTALRPWEWQPVVDRGEAWYDNEYAARPSVVLRKGVYYMAYSALGLQRWLVSPGASGYQTTVTRAEETADGRETSTSETRWVPGTLASYVYVLRACVMGARSSDGIHWEKTPGPIAIAPGEHTSQWTTFDFAGGVPRGYRGAYQRPCLLFDEGRWRMWYAYYLSGNCIAMGYRENRRDFMDPTDWDRGFAASENEPLLRDWPNPSVVRAFDTYLAFSDRGRYTSAGNQGRLTVAESDDGLRWRVTGQLQPEGAGREVGGPEACFTEDGAGPSVHLFYSCADITGPDAGKQCGVRLMRCPIERRLMVPQPRSEWQRATPIVETGGEVESFSLFGQQGQWKCIAVETNGPGTLFTGTHDGLSTRFAPLDPAAEPFFSRGTLPGGLTDLPGMRGPFVRLLDPVTPLLCYGQPVAEGDPAAPSRMQMDVLGRNGWQPYGPERPLGERFLFEEQGCRDPMITWDPGTSLFVTYYVGPPGGVQVRTSPDLMTWSDPRTVVACPPGYGTAEAPFAVLKEGYYYLFVSSEDHMRMAVYGSLDPLNFGDADRDMLVELPGHAPEIVRADGVDYIACCSIRSADGPDLKGVYLQELDWVE